MQLSMQPEELALWPGLVGGVDFSSVALLV